MTTKATSRRQKVIEAFESFDEPMSIPEFAAECLRLGIYPKEDRDKFLLRAVQADVRSILNSHDVEGVPVALLRDVSIEETDGDRAVVRLFVQRTLWREDDARTWVKARVRQLRDDYEKLSRTIRYFEERFPETDWWALVDLPWREGTANP